MIEEFKRPGILVGGGAYKSRAVIERFAIKHHIPVFRTWSAHDVITDDSSVFGGVVGTYGGSGRNFGIQNCDLLFILGCRLSGRITGGSPHTFARGAKRFWVDLDNDLMREHELRPSQAIEMDCGEFIGGLSETGDFSAWLEKCREWVDKYDAVKPEHLSDWHHYGFMRRFSELVPSNAVVTFDTGGNAIMMGQCFKSKRGQRIFSSNGNTPMGFSMCGAIGAWFADPKRPIICVIGDGGMQLNIQELQTIKHYKIPVKVFIIDNGVLGNTKSYQRVNKKPEIACGPDGYSSPFFQAIAKAYGIEAEYLSEWSRFEYVVQRSLKSDVAVVVDVLHEDFCTYEPRISRWDLPIEDMYPHIPRDEFKKNMLIEPVSGWEMNQ